nr:hypothetical protein [Nonomuraea sp. MG754425]
MSARPAAAVDRGAEQRPGGAAGAGQVELEQGDVAAVVEQDGADAAALAVDADVFVVQPQAEVFDVQPAHLGGAGAAHVGGLEQHPVAQPVQRHVLARPSRADHRQHLGHVGRAGRAGQVPGHRDGVDAVHRVGVQQVVADGPFGEGGDGGALVLAAGRRQLGEPGQVGPDRRGGQLGEVVAVVSGEGDQVAAVGAPGVRRLPGVGQVGEEIVQVRRERVGAAELLGDDRIHRVRPPPSAELPDNRETKRSRRATAAQLALCR